MTTLVMRHVRLTEPVFAGFTGWLLAGAAEFRDGVSVEPLRWDLVAELDAVAGPIVDSETGERLGALASTGSVRELRADDPRVLYLDVLDALDRQILGARYSRADLATIADRAGRDGLALIAKVLDLPLPASIAEGISAIFAVRGIGPADAPLPESEPQPNPNKPADRRRRAA